MKKTKIFTIFTILILLMATIFIVPTQADETVNITKSMGKYQYFMDYTNGWTTLGTPFYSANGKVTYCLEHKEPSPYVNTEYSGSTTPFDYFTPRTLRGLQIILKNGYPNVIPNGLNADQSRYATANAIRFWLSEEGMPRQYTYTNLTNVNIDLLAQNGYVSGCRVKANTNAPGSKATLAFAIELLKLAREQERLQYSVSFSPENLNLTKQGEYYVGQTTVILQGLTGNYELNDSVLPVKLCTKWFKNWQKTNNLGFPELTFHEIRHSSSTYKLRISGGDTKSVQGDTGHSKADTLINTYSHIEDPRRMHLSHTIEEDFYGKPAKPVVTATTDIIELIKNNPEMKRKAYEALIGEFS